MAAVRSLMVYEAAGAVKMFAATDGTIKDVTSAGLKNASAVSGLVGNDWIHVNFATSGGNFLIAANGTDDVRSYDGSVWASPAISGVTSSSLNYVAVFKSQLVFLRAASSIAYFLPVDSIAGTVTVLNAGAELTKGGTLVAAAALTQDAGEGPDDFCVLVSSEGEVLVYSGTDPRSAQTWAKVGTFQIGRPIGRRCLMKLGGDIAVLTQDGVVSLTQAIQIDRAAMNRAAFTANIRKVFAAQYALTGAVFGWQLISWPAAHMAIVNVPIVDGVTFHQYVINVLTGAWCRFTGVNAVCWALNRDALYFGGVDGEVFRFGSRSEDDGAAIDATCIGAFTQLRHAGRLKHVKMVQIFAKGTGTFNLGANIAKDFTPLSVAVAQKDIATNAGGDVWDTDLWDSATWADLSELAEESWLGLAESGHFLAPVILGQVSNVSKIDAEFISQNILYEPGAVVG